MGLQSNGLSLEVVGREISGRPVPGKPRRPAGPYLLGLPALLLSSLLLIPIAVTVVAAFRTPDGSFGLGNFAVMGDRAALHAVGNSLAWIGVALALVVVGFLLALLSYRLPGVTSFLQPALVIPFAVSVLVSGATFRLIFDPAPEHGTVTAVFSQAVRLQPRLARPRPVLARAGLRVRLDLARVRRIAVPRGPRRHPGRRDPNHHCRRRHRLAKAARSRTAVAPTHHRRGDTDPGDRCCPRLRPGAHRGSRPDAA